MTACLSVSNSSTRVVGHQKGLCNGAVGRIRVRSENYTIARNENRDVQDIVGWIQRSFQQGPTRCNINLYTACRIPILQRCERIFIHLTWIHHNPTGHTWKYTWQIDLFTALLHRPNRYSITGFYAEACWPLNGPLFSPLNPLYFIVGVGVTGPPLSTNWSGRVLQVLQAISSVMAVLEDCQ